MTKITLNNLSSISGNEQSAINSINSNNATLETFSGNTISRDGTSPNQMLSSLDMNSFRILNLPTPTVDTDPVRLVDISGINSVVYAPINASYLTLNTEATLTNERVLTAGTGITLLDGGAGSTLTITAAGNVAGPASATPTAIVKFNGATGKLVQNSGVLIDSSNNITPATDDAGALGTNSLEWSDLFLASGAVINFNVGDVSLTHSPGTLTNSGKLNNVSPIKVVSNSAIPAGGTAGLGYQMSSVTNFGIFFGSGVPTLSAAQGSLYLRSDGSSTSTRLYVNTNGSTTWTNVTTAT